MDLPLSELLRVLLHALVLGKLNQFPRCAAHVHGGGPGRGQVTQRLPDEGDGVISPGAGPQLHGQTEAANDGDSWSSTHLKKKHHHHHLTFNIISSPQRRE